MTDARTVNYNLVQPEFDKPRYHTDVNANFAVIDALLAKYVAVLNVQGVWANSTVYTAGMHVVDSTDGQLYRAVSNHTSSSSPETFAEYRDANPGVWASATLGVRARGEWAALTTYALGDYVVNGGVYAICTTAHTSSTSFASDAANWAYLIDFQASDVMQQLTAGSGTLNIDWSLGTHVVLTVSATTTITFTPRTMTGSRTQTLRVTTVGGAFAHPIWPTARWPGGAVPTHDETAGARAEYIFTTSDNGASYDAFLIAMRMG